MMKNTMPDLIVGRVSFGPDLSKAKQIPIEIGRDKVMADEFTKVNDVYPKDIGETELHLKNLSDKERAQKYKERLLEAYASVLALLDEANADGFEVMINTNKNAAGRNVVNVIQIIKVY